MVDYEAPIYLSTKTYTHSIGLSACFRQWRAESHCRFLHGYSLEVRVVFVAVGGLDVRNWVVDFGGLKSFKGILENTFDHKTLMAEDDPEMQTFQDLAARKLIDLVVVPACGCERFAGMIYDVAQTHLKDMGYGSRVDVYEVEVREHAANSAVARNPKFFHTMGHQINRVTAGDTGTHAK